MPLTAMPEMLRRARDGGYAIGYFESWDLASLEGVIDAAEAVNSPIIIGFNGDFLSASHADAAQRLVWFGALARAAAESAGVPCGLIFNECDSDAWTRRAVTAGFNAIMPAVGGSSADAYQERVRDLTNFAHAHGVAVEAEVGELPSGVPGHANEGSALTGPDEAAAFVRATGVDMLAVSAGNVHVLTQGAVDLDLDHLQRVCAVVDVPLVLHGGSGISAESLQRAIATGVAKVNYGTYLKQRYLKALRAALAVDAENPHELLGMGGDRDIMAAGQRAVRDAVLERLPLLGSEGKA